MHQRASKSLSKSFARIKIRPQLFPSLTLGHEKDVISKFIHQSREAKNPYLSNNNQERFIYHFFYGKK